MKYRDPAVWRAAAASPEPLPAATFSPIGQPWCVSQMPPPVPARTAAVAVSQAPPSKPEPAYPAAPAVRRPRGRGAQSRRLANRRHNRAEPADAPSVPDKPPAAKPVPQPPPSATPPPSSEPPSAPVVPPTPTLSPLAPTFTPSLPLALSTRGTAAYSPPCAPPLASTHQICTHCSLLFDAGAYYDFTPLCLACRPSPTAALDAFASLAAALAASLASVSQSVATIAASSTATAAPPPAPPTVQPTVMLSIDASRPASAPSQPEQHHRQPAGRPRPSPTPSIPTQHPSL